MKNLDQVLVECNKVEEIVWEEMPELRDHCKTMRDFCTYVSKNTKDGMVTLDIVEARKIMKAGLSFINRMRKTTRRIIKIGDLTIQEIRRDLAYEKAHSNRNMRQVQV